MKGKTSPSTPLAGSPPARRAFEVHVGPLVRGVSKKTSASTLWDVVVDEAPVTVLDKNDPNYDSEEEELDDLLAAFESSLATRNRAIDVPKAQARSGDESTASSPTTMGR